MKNIFTMDTIQIEITNKCVKSCANCTRFVGHHKNTYFMDFDFFKKAIDSLENFPNMIGFQGGEVLLHPEFPDLCSYALSKIPRERLGLWTTFPKGFEHYRKLICKTFGNIFLNSHERPDIYHHPFLVAARDCIVDEKDMFMVIDQCYFQDAWSASINPKGAFFCEIAASFSMLFPNKIEGWPVEKDWWKRVNKDYREQIEEFCPNCGGAICLKRRPSIDKIDDISDYNYEILRKISPKIIKGNFDFHELQECQSEEELAAYKDQKYRDTIASRYGIYLTINEKDFNEPHLYNNPNMLIKKEAIFSQIKRKFK